MIYFWSDTHFNHGKCIEFCDRHWANVRDMNDALVKRWNSAVGPQDTIYFLGDFAFNTNDGDSIESLFALLRGHKHLIVGNHDERNKKVLRLPWESIGTLRTVKDHEMRAEICHYPLESWKKSAHGALMIHGHCHGTLRRTIPHRFDVGVDVRPIPVSFETLWFEASTQTWEACDHHTEHLEQDTNGN